jgi:hypothetical protein
LPAGAYAFLGALAAGSGIGQATERGMASARSFDLAECFRILIAARITVALELAKKPHTFTPI